MIDPTDDGPTSHSLPPMDDDVEGSWDRPLTGAESGVWCVDLIEEISNNDGQVTERAQALLRRLASLDTPGDHELTLKYMAQAAMLVTRELKWYIDTDKMIPVDASGEEKYKRALLAARAAFRGGGTTEARSPYLPSDEG